MYRKSSNYFSACLIYIDDTITNFIFYNIIFCIGIIAYKFCIWLFFVEVKENESIVIFCLKVETCRQIKGKNLGCFAFDLFTWWTNRNGLFCMYHFRLLFVSCALYGHFSRLVCNFFIKYFSSSIHQPIWVFH